MKETIRIILLGIFTLILSSTGFSESKSTLAFGLDWGYSINGYINKGMGLGGSVELVIAEQVSLFLNAGYESSFVGVPIKQTVTSYGYSYDSYVTEQNSSTLYLGDLSARYYFGKALSGFYAGLGLGIYSAVAKNYSYTSTGLMVPMNIGFKLIDDNGGFFLEPYAGLCFMADATIPKAFVFGARFGLGI